VKKGLWISFILLTSIITGPAFAAEPSQGTKVLSFTTYEEFLGALDNAGLSEFIERAGLTSVDNLRVWQLKLPRDQIDKLPLWNKKLAHLPSVGFVPQRGILTLTPPTQVDYTVGFKPNLKSTPPFASFEEFVSSIKNDAIEVFNQKLYYTTEENFNRWAKKLSIEDPALLQQASDKSSTFRQIGYGPEKLSIPESFSAKSYAGYGLRDSPQAIQSFDEFKRLAVSENVSELKSRLYYTPRQLAAEWANELKAVDPEAHRLYIERRKTRVVFQGFRPPCDLPQSLNALLR